MNIAILTWDTPPRPSGLGRAAFEIASALRDRNARVTLIDASRPVGEAAEIEGLRIVGCAPPDAGVWATLRRRLGVGHLVAPRFFRAALMREHRAQAFDVVESTNWYAPAALLGRAAPPLVVRNSTPALDAWAAEASPRDRLDLRLAHRLERRTARGAAALVSNTRGHRDLIREVYGLSGDEDHAVIGLALDPRTVERGATAGPPPTEPFRSLFVGRMERRKGFDEALAAYGLLVEALERDGRPAPVLDIAGVETHELAPRLARLPPAIARTVVAHGRVDDDVLHDLYAGATVVLAPSRYESYGLVYREAAAFGRPLIACAQDQAAREFVSETGCGVLAERCEARPLADALRALHDDPARRERLATRGRAAAAFLSRERLADETLAVYRRAASGARRGARG